ncbi:MAG TPA: TPM domain-containing protein [Bryobacteraceae bacterium]|nr:TPM domain-containing protein [Bryobacteraceae bacterium]
MVIDKERIKRSIQRAERRTSGEIRVSVSPLFWGDVRKVAEKAFQRLGMTATKDRNAVLFFVVPARRAFVVLGDSGIHEKVGQDFWHHIADTVSGKFKQGDFTGGLVAGIEAVGEDLAKHFPGDTGSDTNELPDDVDYGSGT